jgi:hypothetical protein
MNADDGQDEPQVIHTERQLLISIYRGVTKEGRVFGIVLLIVGVVVWQFKHIRGIGDGLISVALVILLYTLLRWVQHKIVHLPIAQRLNFKLRDWL